MRDFIACLSIWLGAPLRRTLRSLAQRAANWIGPPAPAPLVVFPAAPGYLRRTPPVHVLRREQPLDGHALAMARPYLVAYERRAQQGVFA